MLRYVHGSEDSLDVDVFYVFEELPSFKECQEFCSSKEENRNIIVVEDGIVTNCFKGTIDEVNNGLLDTYSLHQQEFENVVTKRVPRDNLIKMVRVLRCLLSHCSKTIYREEVKRALRSSDWKEKIEILKSIDFKSINDYGKSGSKEDVFKIFAFQLGQFFGLMSGKEFYTKSSISESSPRLHDYLYRCKNKDVDTLVEFINLFIDVCGMINVNNVEGITYFVDFHKAIDLKTEKYVVY